MGYWGKQTALQTSLTGSPPPPPRLPPGAPGNTHTPRPVPSRPARGLSVSTRCVYCSCTVCAYCVYTVCILLMYCVHTARILCAHCSYTVCILPVYCSCFSGGATEVHVSETHAPCTAVRCGAIGFIASASKREGPVLCTHHRHPPKGEMRQVRGVGRVLPGGDGVCTVPPGSRYAVLPLDCYCDSGENSQC